MKNFTPLQRPVSVWWRCYNWPTNFPKKDVSAPSCFFVILARGAVTTSKTNHCLHATLEYSASYISCFVLESRNAIVPANSLCQMLPKTKKAGTTTDLWPIASTRLMHKTLALLVFGRTEELLEHAQLEEQHGFKPKRMFGEYVLSASMVIGRTLLANRPMWILRLDFSKALWTGMFYGGVCDYMGCQLLLFVVANGVIKPDGPTGQISGHTDLNRQCCIKVGVRQGCALSPRLWCPVLQVTMRDWRCDVSNNGLDLGDGGQPSLDLRFADDIVLLAMFDKLVLSLWKIGLKRNAAKSMVVTTQAQPPTTLTTRPSFEDWSVGPSHHKRLGCIFSTANASKRQDDIDNRLTCAVRAFHVHKRILCDKMVLMASRLTYFHDMIASAVCFAAGKGKMYTKHFRKFDVHCRKLRRRVLGPSLADNTSWYSRKHWLDSTVALHSAPVEPTCCGTNATERL